MNWFSTEHWMQSQYLLIPNWKWILLVSFCIAGPILRKISYRIVNYFTKRIQASAPGSFVSNSYLSYLNQRNIAAPLSWIFLILAGQAVLQSLELPTAFDHLLSLALIFGFSLQSIILAYKAAEAFGLWMDRWAMKSGNALNMQLAPFATKTLKIIVIVFGVLLTLQSMGLNVASLLAGIGIGSLALALAAQDTAANLFGSVMIILDRPFQVGDWIRVIDTEGVVEEVGFRSTRIRTFARSLVTIPNSTMAKERIDNLGVRPTRRIRHVLSLEYGTPVAKIQEFSEKLRYWISTHPQLAQPAANQGTNDEVIVSLTGLGDFAIQILVVFYIQVNKTTEELRIQQEFLTAAYELAKDVEVSFAFPSQTLYISNQNKKQETSL